SVGTGTTGNPPAKAMPLASPSPMRSPVNDPGPMDTATPSTSRMVSRASASARSTSPGSDTRWVRLPGSAVSPRSTPSHATPTAAVQVAVWRPRTIRGSALHQPMEVVVEHEDHQAEEQQQPDLLRQLAVPLPEGPTECALDREQRQMPPVERRDG